MKRLIEYSVEGEINTQLFNLEIGPMELNNLISDKEFVSEFTLLKNEMIEKIKVMKRKNTNTSTVIKFKSIAWFLLSVVIMVSSCSNNHSVKLAQKNQETENYWEQNLDEILLLMGHRNWIIVADMAYPLQSKKGITTIFTNESQIETLKKVYEKINAAPHIKANVYLDKEIDFVDEKFAKGIVDYRKNLEPIIGSVAQKVLHEELISKLDKSAEMFNILILKTNMTLPYTSVFFELDCGYWCAEGENALRKNIKQTK